MHDHPLLPPPQTAERECGHARPVRPLTPRGFAWPTTAKGQADADADAPLAGLLKLVLDELDYGVIALSAHRRIMFANRAARQACVGQSPSYGLDGGMFRATRTADQAALDKAVFAAAYQARRSLLRLGDLDQPVLVAIVPLAAWVASSGGACQSDTAESPLAVPRVELALTEPVEVLLLFSRRQMCETLSIEFYARAYGLTHAETAVLCALCRGEPPSAVAEQAGVAISTVRTQVSSIRQKTGTNSLRDLVRQVAMLPPIVPALASWTAH